MNIAITGARGFLGWHTACRLRALHGTEPVLLGREDFADVATLTGRLESMDVVLHIAGVNRAETDEIVERDNVEIARMLSAAITATGHNIDVVYANSIHSNQDNAYGRGKSRAAAVLQEAVHAAGGRFADLLLPNLFGEHGRPGYNSFVATFAHAVISDETPRVTDDREIELVHAQRAAKALIEAVGLDGTTTISGERCLISEVLAAFQKMHKIYAGRGEIPDLSSDLIRDLFNTYRAAAFPAMWPIRPQVHSDARGGLFEAVRSHGGKGMVYASTTRSGQKRGEHYHLHKVERFVVVRGQAEIQLRRLLHDEVIRFQVDGDDPQIIDMPTLWVHNIRNIGSEDLVTLFWSDQLLDPENPDQFPEKIERGVMS